MNDMIYKAWLTLVKCLSIWHKTTDSKSHMKGKEMLCGMACVFWLGKWL